MDKIILLDLNRTLALHIEENKSALSYNVTKDVYRQDLAQAIKGKRIFIITARTDNYQEETLKKIYDETGLKIERSYFKPQEKARTLKVHDFKKQVVLQLFEEEFKPEDFFGIESNINTRKAYASVGVDSCRYEDYMKKYASEPVITD